MNRNKLAVFTLFCLLALAPGCGTLDPNGPYRGDKTLYDADVTIATSYAVIDSFLEFELKNRGSLPKEVTVAADGIRSKAPQAFKSATAIRDAYASSPNSGTRTALQTAIDIVRALATEASKNLITSKKLS